MCFIEPNQRKSKDHAIEITNNNDINLLLKTGLRLLHLREDTRLLLIQWKKFKMARFAAQYS